MSQQIPTPVDFDRPVSRSAIFTLLSTAMRVKEYRFARQTALAWLAAYPGDLGINLVHAQALLGEEKYSQVNPIAEDLCLKDPEYLPAQRIRTKPQVFKNPDIQARGQASVFALTGESRRGVTQPEWSQLTWTARLAFQAGDMEKAERLIHQAMLSDLPSPLPAILHLQITRTSKDFQELHNLATLYSTRWPECIQFKLYLAESLIQTGDENGSVALLHQCAAHDPAGQVANRILGPDHPYRTLWPQKLEILFDLPVPAGVAAALGWNQLGGGPPVIPTPVEEAAIETPEPGPPASEGKGFNPKAPEQTRITPDAIRAIQEELERLARRLRKPGTGRGDGRFPIYVVLSSRKGLEGMYGPQTTSAVVAEMKNLADSVRKRQNWGSVVFLADDPVSTTAFGLKPVPGSDPWKLKLALSDLDAALAKKGEMIGAMLIVGGPEIVPFHRLPNPTEDADAEVLSDNPYASLDENYFIPDWPVGRLPGGSGSDAGLLIAALRKLVTYQSKQSHSTSWWRRAPIFRNLIKGIKTILPHAPATRPVKPSFGYSAAVWKQSSQAVYRAIGEPTALLTCPPAVTGTLLETNQIPANIGYYNLHGLADSPEWYGQRENGPIDTGGPDYPVALSPKDVLNSNQAMKFIFSEACYGAYIDNKTEDQSLALKFLSSGSLAMVGSTCISYGSVSTPLIAADLLGYTYWKFLLEGKSAGEAFQQAKISLVDEMNKRQGYLDGEDQKTLISFVLYGDPLATLEEFGARPKSIVRPHEHTPVRMVCDSKTDELTFESVPELFIPKVKQVVDQYLPGLKDAQWAVSRQQSVFDEEGHPTPGSQMGAKVTAARSPERTVVRLSKQVQGPMHMHYHYARVTLDAKGKVLKLSMSR